MATLLPEDPKLYFDLSITHTMLPTSALVPVHRIKNKVSRAAVLMENAAHGGAKRRPLAVRPVGDGRYYIVDGNSTFAVAMDNNWKAVPCEISKE